MKEKIIAGLKTAYAKLGLSDEAFDGVASLLEKTVKEESEIATAVGGDDVKKLLTTIQGNIDSWKNKFYDTRKDLDKYKEKHPETDPDPKPNPKQDEEPEWARKLRESNERIEARFRAEDDAKRLSQNLSAVEAGLKSAGCVNPGILKGVLKGFALGDKETVEEATERLRKEYNDSYKETFGEGPRPGVGDGNFGGDAKKAAEAMNKYLREEGLLPKEE